MAVINAVPKLASARAMMLRYMETTERDDRKLSAMRMADTTSAPERVANTTG